MSRKLKIGVLGARRGSCMVNVMARHPDAQLEAVCDFDKRTFALAKRQQGDAKIHYYTDFDKFLNHDLDAIVLANYATEHVPFAIRALDSGRHVCSEVLACSTLAEAVQLVEAVERNRKVYTYAENYCYFRGTMEMQRLFRRGDVGEFMHGEGEYVHDCESIWPAITRGEKNHWRNWAASTFYCTHSLGPIMTITGTRPTRITAYETPNRNKQRFGARSADGSIIVCQMSNGATTKILPWCNFKRRPEAIWYCVYGTKGMMETDRWGATVNRLNVYIEDDQGAIDERAYSPRPWLETALSKKIGGHSGSDFFTMHFFLESILKRPGAKHAIDVYQALDMTLPGTLGYRSICNGNIPIDVPDFRKKAIRDKYRNDHWSLNPALAGPGQPTASCSQGKVVIPASVYRKQAATAGVYY